MDDIDIDGQTGLAWFFSWLLKASLATPITLIAVLLSTYGYSLLQSHPAGPDRGHEPPIAPYWVPYLQHLPGFLYNPSRTFRSLNKKYAGQPFTMLMMNTKFHIFHDSATASHVFASSRKFVFEPVLASMMENGMSLPAVDQPKFQLPSHANTGEKDSASFVAANHKLWLKHLTGKSLADIMAVYETRFHRVLAAQLYFGPELSQTVQLHDLLQRLIFDTSVEAFLGPRIKKLWPEMWDDWNVYNQATYIGVRTDAAYRLNPRAGLARERMLKAFEQWISIDIGDEWDDATDGVWNETWGAKLNWERERLGLEAGFTLRGRACLHASFLFVFLVNAVSLVTWFTWCATNSEERLEEFRAQAKTYMRPSTTGKKEELRLDPSEVTKNAFVQGLWKEALRLGTASAAARVVMEDAVLEGYMVKKGSVILMPAAIMHHDERIFPEPQEVKPERWTVEDKGDVNALEQLQQRQRSLRPFGGGTGLCSGRFVAEQEIIGVVSTLLLLFDIEFDDSWRKGYSFNPRSIGYMEPTEDPVVRLRRRKTEA